MQESGFDAFWEWCAKGPAPFSGLTVTVEGKSLLISHGGTTSPYRIRCTKAKEYFGQVCAGSSCPSSYFKTVLGAYRSKDDTLAEDATSKSAKVAHVTTIKSPDECICLCLLCRQFLHALEKRHICLQTAALFPSEWLDWCIQGAQIKPYRKANQRPPIAAILQDYLGRCAVATNYRDIWRQTVADLMRLGLKLGQAQKLVNLLSKYCFAYYFAEVDRKWMASNAWVREFAGDCDIPIDQIVLKKLKRSWNQTDMAGGIYVHGQGTKAQAGVLCRHVTPNVAASWNNLTCFGCYAEIQEFVRRESGARGYVFPMEFEMAVLWP